VAAWLPAAAPVLSCQPVLNTGLNTAPGLAVLVDEAAAALRREDR
jgi:hypothetical protein